MAKRRMPTFERLKAGRMNRAQRRELGRRVAAGDPHLAIVNPNAEESMLATRAILRRYRRIGMKIPCGSLVVGHKPCTKWRNG